MAVTVEQLEQIEGGWVQLQREFGLDDETIATNLGYKLVAKN